MESKTNPNKKYLPISTFISVKYDNLKIVTARAINKRSSMDHLVKKNRSFFVILLETPL